MPSGSGRNNPMLQTFDTISPPRIYNMTAPSRTSSLFTYTPSEQNLDGVAPEYDGYASLPPADERLAEKKDEQRYRMLLNHQFHRSC